MANGSGVDQELLLSALSEFTHTLANRFDVTEVLYQLAEHVVGVLGVAGTGVSVIDEHHKLRPVTGINELTTTLELTEEQLQEGPCVDAYRQGRVVPVEDLKVAADRWPSWSSVARERGVRAVLGVPLRVRDESLGAMNIYSTDDRTWQEADIRVACILSDMAASYVAHASDLQESRRLSQQLREALDSRVVIEQAKGVLAGEMHCSIDQAFAVLRNHSRRHGASLRTVAVAVVNLGLRPDRTSEPMSGERRRVRAI
jgi:GAF domain-containing protein